MHIAVLDANTDDSAFAQRHPNDPAKFRRLLTQLRPDWQVTGINVKTGEAPANIHDFDGYIVTGSPASVHDPLPWLGGLFDLIRQAASQNIPIYGACFGHQAIALALGGKVEKNPQGWEFGRIETQLTQPWDGAAKPMSLYAAHKEQVTELPPGAVITGETPGCDIAAFAIGKTIWTTQYHPEMTPDFIADLVEEYADHLTEPVATRARVSLQKQADEQAIAASITAFFENA